MQIPNPDLCRMLLRNQFKMMRRLRLDPPFPAMIMLMALPLLVLTTLSLHTLHPLVGVGVETILYFVLTTVWDVTPHRATVRRVRVRGGLLPTTSHSIFYKGQGQGQG